MGVYAEPGERDHCGGGADQRPGRAERVREPGGRRQRFPADQEAGYRGFGEGEADRVV